MPEAGLMSQIRTSACLRIFGFHLNFEEISQGLGVRPSQTHRAGNFDARRRPRVSDLWLLEAPLPETEAMDAHIQWLRRTLEPHYSFLRGLKENAQVRSYCGLTADDRGTLRLSAEGLSLFTDLAIDLEIGIVFLGPADSGESAEDLGPTDKTEAEIAQSEPPAYRTRSQVALQVVGAGLDLSSISAQLGFGPSKAHHLGETDSAGNPYPTDSWSLVAPLPRRDALDEHLKWLGMALLPHSGFLRSLKYQAELLVRCDFGTESDTGGVRVSPEGLRVCTEPDIPIEFEAFLI